MPSKFANMFTIRQAQWGLVIESDGAPLADIYFSYSAGKEHWQLAKDTVETIVKAANEKLERMADNDQAV